MTAKFLFDVDGVLCDRGQPINDQFRWWLEDFLIDKEYYLVTGSPRNKTMEQIGERLTMGSKIGYHCLGNSIWTENGFEVVINQFTFSENEFSHLKSFYMHSMYQAKQAWEDVIQYRSGSCNFSFVKRGASIEERQSYIDYDSRYHERTNFITQLNECFPRFDCYLGGDCSVDIVLRGANKARILRETDATGTVYFFGDRCDEYGIDKPLYDILHHLEEEENELYDTHPFKVTGGYKETWEILKSLTIL